MTFPPYLEQSTPEEPAIIFSVIIPTHNRPQLLSLCLDALARSDFKKSDFEVIIVDDGGDVPLEPVLERFRDRISLKLLRQENAGPAAARNAGAMDAKGRFLAFIDDDCKSSPNWLSSILARLSQGPERMVGGRTANLSDDNVYAVANQLIRDLIYSFYNADKMNSLFFSSNNIALPAGLFRDLGGFDPAFRVSEDRDLCDRWLGKGYRMVYEPDAVVYHSKNLTFGNFWRMYVSYGRGAFRYNRAHAARNGSASTLKPDFYIYIIRRLRSVLSGRPMRQSLSLVFLLALWQVANAFGFLKEGCKG